MPPAPRSVAVRLETWLWTGPLGHLVGGVLDWARLLSLYLLGRLRARAASERRALGGRLTQAGRGLGERLPGRGRGRWRLRRER